jgi:hypothetical protein
MADAPQDAGTKAVEDWARDFQTEAWLLAGARALNRWGEGRQLTEAEYRQALEAFGGMRLGTAQALQPEAQQQPGTEEAPAQPAQPPAEAQQPAQPVESTPQPASQPTTTP